MEVYAICDITGSPPPMRGKGLIYVQYRHVPRITPAYAGKSAITSRAIVSMEDHPRLCGEKKLFPVVSVRRDRITPAYAGKSHN